MGLIATTLLGTGVFILPQHTLSVAGDMAIWAWALLLMAVLPLAYVFAQLGRRYANAAGPAYFVEQAFGVTAGRTIGLLFLFVVPPGTAAAMIMTLEFVSPLIILTAEQKLLIQLLMMLVLFFINRRGLQLSGKIQLGLTLSIVAVVAAMFIMQLLAPPTARIVQTVQNASAAGGYGGLMAAVGIAIWSFLGIEAITHLASEFRDVKRDFLPATLGGIVLVGIVFIACTWLSMASPEHSLAMVGTFEKLFGDSGRWIIGGLGLVSGFATINVYFSSLSRLAWSFSNDGVLPAPLKKLNRHQTPVIALVTFMSVAALMQVLSYVMALDFITLAEWVNGAFVLIYSASMLAAWKLLPGNQRPAIALGLLVCGIFVICLGEAMIYAVLLMAAIVLAQLASRSGYVRSLKS